MVDCGFVNNVSILHFCTFLFVRSLLLSIEFLSNDNCCGIYRSSPLLITFCEPCIREPDAISKTGEQSIQVNNESSVDRLSNHMEILKEGNDEENCAIEMTSNEY